MMLPHRRRIVRPIENIRKRPRTGRSPDALGGSPTPHARSQFPREGLHINATEEEIYELEDPRSFYSVNCCENPGNQFFND